MFRLHRHGERKALPKLSTFLCHHAPEPPLVLSTIISAFLEGLCSTRFDHADILIVGAVPSTHWPKIDPVRQFDLLFDTALRCINAIPTAPTRLLAAEDLIPHMVSNPMTIALRDALARRYRGTRERAWILGATIADLHQTIGNAKTSAYIDAILNTLEATRQRYLRSQGLPTCLPPRTDTHLTSA